MLDAPGFALIGWTSALASSVAIEVDGVLDAAGVDDDADCGIAPAPDASLDTEDCKPIAHSIQARTWNARFISFHAPLFSVLSKIRR
jgi:hypothetical protein